MCCFQGLEVTWVQREKDTIEAAENTAEANMAVHLDIFLLSLTIHHWPSSANKSLCSPNWGYVLFIVWRRLHLCISCLSALLFGEQVIGQTPKKNGMLIPFSCLVIIWQRWENMMGVSQDKVRYYSQWNPVATCTSVYNQGLCSGVDPRSQLASPIEKTQSNFPHL